MDMDKLNKCTMCLTWHSMRTKQNWKKSWRDSLSIAGMLLGLLLCMLPVISAEDSRIHTSIVEEVPMGTIVAKLLQDAGLAGKYSSEPEILSQLQFSFVGQGEHQDLFRVESNTGIIRTKSRVDRDEICPNEFACQASLRILVKPNYEVIQVDITIVDRNDNNPVFPQDRILHHVSEATGQGVLFPVQPAKDPDHPENSTKQYELVGGDGIFGLDVHNNTLSQEGDVDLRLTLIGDLDRELRDFYQVKVVAYDGGIPPKTGQVLIDIQVDDANDNNPEFDSSTYSVTVPEDTPVGKTILTLQAHDKDDGDFGTVTYKLNTKSQRLYGNIFQIDPHTGELSLLTALDYEKTTSYTLGIVAEDGGPGSIPASTAVMVTVLDVNDHEPLITVDTVEGSGQVAITEHMDPKTFVALVSVTDPDSGENGKVHCSLNNSSHFQLISMIENNFKIVTVGSLDREQGERYHVVVECADNGDPPRTSATNITVMVEDINDHTPTFVQSVYEASLPENNEWNAVVTTVKAIDYDAGINGHIVYMLDEDAGDQFHVDPDTGRVTALVSFDFEQVQQIEFHVIAADSSDNMRLSKALVRLTITDLDDNPPMFTQASYVFSVSENLPARTSVGTVSASDNDEPPYNKVTYALDLHDEASVDFNIDSVTGVIYTKRMLDRERTQRYDMTVYAHSSATPPVSDSCRVSIYVDDKNDNPPIIDFPNSKNQSVDMLYSATQGDVVATITAHDLDNGPNGVLFYMIAEGNEGGEFTIDELSGEVQLSVDPETLTKALYKLKIMVRDSGDPHQIAVGTLNIVVQGSPIAPPEFPTGGTGIASESKDSEQKEKAGGAFSKTHLAIVISVIVGCLIVALALILAIVVVRRKTKRLNRPSATAPHQDDLYWPKQGGIPGGVTPSVSVDNGGLQRDDSKMTEISQISDIILSLDTEPMNYQSRVAVLQQSTGHSPKSDLDGDSGCADLSNNGSQTSNEDSEGSKRSSKASDGGSEMPLPPPPASMLASRPQVIPPSTLPINVPPMPLLQRTYSDRRPSHPLTHSPDLSLSRRYPYEPDSPLRRTLSTPPKCHTLGPRGAGSQVPPGALAAARASTLSAYYSSRTGDGRNVASLPRSLSSCSSKKAVRFTDDLTGPNGKAQKHVTFADHDDVCSGSGGEEMLPPPPQDMTESGYYEGMNNGHLVDNTDSCSSASTDNIPMSSYPPDGTYTTFIPVKNTSLSSLV